MATQQPTSDTERNELEQIAEHVEAVQEHLVALEFSGAREHAQKIGDVSECGICDVLSQASLAAVMYVEYYPTPNEAVKRRTARAVATTLEHQQTELRTAAREMDD